MQKMYTSNEYINKNPTYHVEYSGWKVQQILKAIRKKDLHPLSVCEVGCGAGEILKQLQLYLPDEAVLFGYEISTHAHELCKQRVGRNLQFFCQDLIETDTNLFDLLLCIDVFEHVEDYMSFLRKLRQKSIYKLFHIPLDMSVHTVLRCKPILDARSSVGHLHYFSKETALLTLHDTGYEILDYFYTPSGLDTMNTLNAKLWKLPRMIFSRIHPDLSVRILGGYSLMVLAK